ncbi:MAG: type II toxin-antitoxin system RelE/ParE family toxin [Candidatus Woesearchaeota archaeon]|nr:type II toxin-antitoxin system RelE/ParE family toxin [Candidatus Woesearchaeota archaeon]
MYSCEMRKRVEQELFKLVKKDRKQMEAINKKINEIICNPYHYKNLRAPLERLRRVHIGSFVIVFSIDEKRKLVIIEEYAHHDEIYKKADYKF